MSELETVWQLTCDRRFDGWTKQTVDEIVDLFPLSSSQSKREWFRNHCLWTPVFANDRYTVFMGYRCPAEEDVNFLATRILIDQDQLNLIASLQNRDNFASHCVRGPAVFYRLKKDNSGKTMTFGPARPVVLDKYTWSDFCEDWPKFFCQLDEHLPYMRLYDKFTRTPFNEWLAVAVREDSEKISQYMAIMGLRASRAVGTKYLVNAAVLAVMLRRMNKEAWDTISIRHLLSLHKK